jgi:hypothetical protein
MQSKNRRSARDGTGRVVVVVVVVGLWKGGKEGIAMEKNTGKEF